MENLENLLQEYLKSLNEKEMQSYLIAKSHLGSSFCLEKSNGFIEWKKEKEKKIIFIIHFISIIILYINEKNI